MAESIIVESLPESFVEETIALIISHESIKEEPLEYNIGELDDHSNEFYSVEKCEEIEKATSNYECF